MINSKKIYLENIDFKLKAISSYLKINEFVNLEDVTFFKSDNFFSIKNDNYVIIYKNKFQKNKLLFLYELKNDNDFSEIKEDINNFLLKNKLLYYTINGNSNTSGSMYFFKELINPIFSYFFSKLLEKNNKKEIDILPEEITNPEYQISLINNLYGLTREQSLVALLGNFDFNENGVIIYSDLFCPNLKFKKIKKKNINECFDTYLFKKNVSYIRNDWLIILNELKDLLKENNKLVKFRDISNEEALKILDNNFNKIMDK